MMKILIVIPPLHRGEWFSREQKRSGVAFPQNPYLAPQLVAYLRHYIPTLDVQIIDAQAEEFDHNRLNSEINKIKPDLLIVIMSIFALPTDKLIAERNDVPVIGILCPSDIDIEEVVSLNELKIPYLVAKNVLESTINATVEFIEKGLIISTKNIFRYASKGKYIPNSDYINNNSINIIFDHEKFILPAFEDLPLKKYMHIQKKCSGTVQAMVSAQEGCPFNCSFCSKGNVNTKSFYYSPKGVLNEIELLYSYGWRHFHLMHNEIGADKNTAIQLCNLISDSNLDIQWTTNNRVDLMDERLISASKNAGCVEYKFGVESGDVAVRTILNKKFTNKQVIEAFEMIRDYGIRSNAYLMVGIPGETRQSLIKTLELMKKANPDNIWTSIYFPTPCSKLYYQFKNENRLLEKDWSLYRFGNKILVDGTCYVDNDDLLKTKDWFNREIYKTIFLNRLKNNNFNLFNLLAFFSCQNATTYKMALYVHNNYKELTKNIFHKIG